MIVLGGAQGRNRDAQRRLDDALVGHEGFAPGVGKPGGLAHIPRRGVTRAGCGGGTAKIAGGTKKVDLAGAGGGAPTAVTRRVQIEARNGPFRPEHRPHVGDVEVFIVHRGGQRVHNLAEIVVDVGEGGRVVGNRGKTRHVVHQQIAHHGAAVGGQRALENLRKPVMAVHGPHQVVRRGGEQEVRPHPRNAHVIGHLAAVVLKVRLNRRHLRRGHAGCRHARAPPQHRRQQRQRVILLDAVAVVVHVHQIDVDAGGEALQQRVQRGRNPVEIDVAHLRLDGTGEEKPREKKKTDTPPHKFRHDTALAFANPHLTKI